MIIGIINNPDLRQFIKNGKVKKATEKEARMAKSVSKKLALKKTNIKYERHMNREEAVHYFISLVSGMKNGVLQFNHGKETVVVTPAEQMSIEIKVKTHGKMQKVAFEMSWLAAESDDISISSC